jgi:GTP-binding protein HflX
VGFIQNLPKELMEAFHATLDELSDADIILHVIDISNPRYSQQKESVEKILNDLNLKHIPYIYVLNKMDKIDIDSFDEQWLLNQGVLVCAPEKQTLVPLIEELESMVNALKIRG